MAANVLGSCQSWSGSGACQPKPVDDRVEWSPEEPDPRTNGNRHGGSVKAKAGLGKERCCSHGLREPSPPKVHVFWVALPRILLKGRCHGRDMCANWAEVNTGLWTVVSPDPDF